MKIQIKSHAMRSLLATALILIAGAASAHDHLITADIWVDNWFELFANGSKVIEDSVPITTERSFNAESFTIEGELPITISIMAKDFKENDSGLEYIGTNRQQMGDGGMIAQFRDSDTGEVVAVTDNNARCLVVQRAPVDISCARERNPVAGQGACAFEVTETPADWTSPKFDDSAWPAAVEHSESEVRPKDGYDRIDWDLGARLIWSDNLVQDNTLLCRLTIGE